MDINNITFCKEDEHFFIINGKDNKIQIRAYTRNTNAIMELWVPELETKNKRLFLYADISFGYVDCVVCYSIVDGKNIL